MTDLGIADCRLRIVDLATGRASPAHPRDQLMELTLANWKPFRLKHTIGKLGS